MNSKIIRAGLLVSLLLIACATSAHAQEAITLDKRALIKELFEVTGGSKSVTAMLDAIMAQNEKDLPKLMELPPAFTKDMTAEERSAFEKRSRETNARALARLKEAYRRVNYVQVLEDLQASIFDKYFTEGELREWITFYKSPVGKKSIELMPVMMAEMMSKTGEILMPKIRQEVDAILADEMRRLEQEVKFTPKPQSRAKAGKRRRT